MSGLKKIRLPQVEIIIGPTVTTVILKFVLITSDHEYFEYCHGGR